MPLVPKIALLLSQPHRSGVRDKVSLDPVRLEHADAIQHLASHPDVAATTNIPEPYPENGAVSWIMSSMPRQMAGVEHSFAVIREADETLVGVSSLMNVGQGEAELGYWVGHPFWGNGYATHAARHTLDFAFDAIGLEHIYARPLVRNAASCRVLEKLNFQLTDVVDNFFPKWDNDDSLAMYEIQQAEWQTAIPTQCSADCPRTTARRAAHAHT